MLASHMAQADLVPIRVLIVLLAIAGVIFWRIALRVIVIALILLMAFGAVVFLEGFLQTIK